MSNIIVSTRDTQLEKQRISKNQISLTEFDTTDEPAIAAGSVVEIGGSIFVVTVDEAITGWAGIANDTDAYIKLVSDTTSFTAAYTTSAPTWSHAKQGWYNGNDRYIAVIHRGATAADFESKGIIPSVQGSRFSELEIARDLNVQRDADVDGDLTVTGSATVAVDMKATRGYIPQHTLYGTVVTEETIFDAMAASIPDNGDIIGVWGGVGYSNVLATVAYAERHDATTIYFYAVWATGTVVTISINEDDATERQAALAW